METTLRPVRGQRLPGLTPKALILATAAMLWMLGCGASASYAPSPELDDIIAKNKHLKPNRAVKPEELSGGATWYGDRHHGRQTANGEAFDMHAHTAAHRTLPFNTVVRVTEPESQKSVVVRINDRGPRKRSLVIDLSRAAAADLGIVRRGKAPVKLEILVWGDNARYHRHNR